MYRNKDHKLSWSWNRLIVNMVPNFANNSKDDVELSPTQQDDLFRFQLAQPDPRVLAEQSFYVAGVVESPSFSPRILRALHKASILSANPPFVATSNITRQFPHQVAIISVHRQRKLVGLLFFWEEELVRWRLLDEEEAEIRRVLAEVVEAAGDAAGGTDGHAGEELRLALGKVLARKRMLPGTRGEEGTGGLPGYGDGGTVGVIGGRAVEV